MLLLPVMLTASPPFRTATTLAADLDAPPAHALPLVQDFLYQPKVTMLAAEPGVGKSLLATQLALSLSSGTPLFEFLPVPTPQPVYYLQLEGDYEEFLDRVRQMRQLIPVNPDLLCWDTFPVLNVLREESGQRLIQRIKSWRIPALVIIDPIYRTVFGGLSKDEPASAFVRFSTLLQAELGCAQLLLHHTHRPSRTRDGDLIVEADPFYGSQWLKAHVDVSYHMEATDKERSAVRLTCKKSRGANVLESLYLAYHLETMTCSMNVDSKEGDILNRIIIFLNICKQSGKDTDSYEVAERVGGVKRSILSHLQNPHILEKVDFIKRPGHKTIWRVKR